MATQLTTVRLLRGDSTPWGFRLQGGKDWGLPLSVSKVNPGSLAESAGLKIGDIIVKICGQSAESMSHRDAEDAIVRAGNNLDMTVAKSGTSTWKPSVTLVGDVPKPRPISAIYDPQPVTKTSLAHSQPVSKPIGSSHNTTATPFPTFQTPTSVPLVNKQYNSPINMYSMQNIKETLEAHTEVLAPGVKGINFMKPDAPVNTHSAVYQAILDEENERKSTPGNNYTSENQLLENLRHSSSISPTQSSTLRRLQNVLDITGEGVSPIPQSAVPTGIGSPVPTRSGFPPHLANYKQQSAPPQQQQQQQQQSSATRHVEPPKTAPKPVINQQQLQQLQPQQMQQQPSSNVCAECGRQIIGVFCRINEKSLHAECYKCTTCGTSLKNHGHWTINEKLYCELHYQQVRNMNNRAAFEPLVLPVASSTLPSYSHPTFLAGKSGKTSPLVSAVAAMPWHPSSASYHHVDAPASPIPGQGASSSSAAASSIGFSLVPNVPTYLASSSSQHMQRTTAPTGPRPFQPQSNGVQAQGPSEGEFSWPRKAGA